MSVVPLVALLLLILLMAEEGSFRRYWCEKNERVSLREGDPLSTMDCCCCWYSEQASFDLLVRQGARDPEQALRCRRCRWLWRCWRCLKTWLVL